MIPGVSTYRGLAPRAGTLSLAAPANTFIPTISGTAQEGQTLTASPGTWTGNPAPTYAYQWQRGTTNISGATSSTYLVDAADVGNTLRVVVTGTNSEGSAQATSANTATVTAADSGDPEMLLEVAFDGTNDGDGSIAIWGHSLPEGWLQPEDDLLVRSVSGDTERRTQWHPDAVWPDGSVRTFHAATELPSLTDGTIHAAEVWKNQTHSSPGSNLTWSGALSGRSILIKTWNPADLASPLWTYDVADELTSSTDDWMSGPLALCRRVETEVPSSAVRTTGGAAGTCDSMRLVVDVTATKDGCLIVDAMFANDAVDKTTGGTARFGWTIEIDGVMVYDQRPTSGAARDLNQYCAWQRRRGRKGSTTYNFYSTHRPFFRPDTDVLVDSGFILPCAPVPGYTSGSQSTLTAGSSSLTDPYYAWDILRGQSGGSITKHIGQHPGTALSRMLNTSEQRAATILQHIQAETFCGAGWMTWDSANNEPVRPMRWTLWRGDSANRSTPPIIPSTAIGPPSGQTASGAWQNWSLNNTTDHIVADQTHRGDFYSFAGVVDGRRHFIDRTIHTAVQQLMQVRTYMWSGVNGDTAWTGQTPSFTTGVGIGGRGNYLETRGWIRTFEKQIKAAYVCPVGFPARQDYLDTPGAWMAAIRSWWEVEQEPDFDADTGLIIAGDFGRASTSQFQLAYLWHAMAHLGHSGVLGDNTANYQFVLGQMVRFWNKLCTYSDTSLATSMGYNELYVRAPGDAAYHPNIAAMFADGRTVQFSPATGHNGGPDYCSHPAGMLLLAEQATNPEIKALARQAATLLRSIQYRASPNTWPEFFESFFSFGVNYSYAQIYTHAPKGFTWSLASAPVVVPGQSFNCATGATAGTLVGVVEWTGPQPRNDAEGVAAANTAWAITGGTEAAKFTIDMGGAIRRSGSGGTVPAGANVIQVRPRTEDQDGTERLGTAVDVTIVGV